MSENNLNEAYQEAQELEQSQNNYQPEEEARDIIKEQVRRGLYEFERAKEEENRRAFDEMRIEKIRKRREEERAALAEATKEVESALVEEAKRNPDFYKELKEKEIPQGIVPYLAENSGDVEEAVTILNQIMRNPEDLRRVASCKNNRVKIRKELNRIRKKANTGIGNLRKDLTNMQNYANHKSNSNLSGSNLDTIARELGL